MYAPTEFLVHDRWLACIYKGKDYWSWYKDGWTLRHACGKYSKFDLTKIKKLQGKLNHSFQGWTDWALKDVNKIPVVFGNTMRKKKRRAPKGVCPRCKEKIPAGLAIWITTTTVRE